MHAIRPIHGWHRCLPWLAAFVVCAAQAQWTWLDANGQKVFSDRPPPAEIPDHRILSQPGVKPAATASSASRPVASGAAADGPAAPPEAGKPQGKPDAAARKLEEQKKQAEEAEKAKERAEQMRLAKARSEQCAKARAALANLETGTPLRTFNAKGERVYMDEAQRNAEKQQLRQVVQTTCSRP